MIKSTGNFLVDNQKELLYLGGAILLVFAGYKIYKGASKGLSSLIEDSSESVTIDVPINHINTTISNQEAQKYAQQLLDACNEAAPFYGTDEELIKEVFQSLKTGEDFKLVYKFFGKKNYNGNGSPPVGIWRHLDNYSPRDLVYWLRAELSPRDGDVYILVKERIESAGWKF
ncbi:hypothetical protein [Tenacibaculum aiptasiae]|uniref:hypothetical protein n=1 Tax=Tenacibaculum aiptasiae TaxID=426481 RepID=UPI0023301760|nr:hypothetical protein [Tenacibaculum aiptasiae]